jgi:hypothetical protein
MEEKNCRQCNTKLSNEDPENYKICNTCLFEFIKNNGNDVENFLSMFN